MSEEAAAEPATAVAGDGGTGAFAIDAPAFSGTEFKMYSFKIVRCPRARPHDWTQCPFAHPGEKAKRRDPRKYRYSGTACPDFRKTGTCKRADACPFSHGVFECWLHPTRYKTQLCTDGANCRRRVCFFAHSESELRQPEEYAPLPSSAVPADLGAELALQQQQQQHHQHQQQLAVALGGLLGGGTGAGSAAVAPLTLDSLEYLKTLSLGTHSGLLDSSAPSTPIGTAIQPSAAAAFQDFSAQAALLQTLQTGPASATCLKSQRNSNVSVQSVLSMRSNGSPNDGDASPPAQAAPGCEPLRCSTPPQDVQPGQLQQQGGGGGSSAGLVDEAVQIVRLIQQQAQQHEQQLAAAAAAALAQPAGGGVDPALLLALQGLSLGVAGTGGLGQLLEQNQLLQGQAQQQQQPQQMGEAPAALLQRQHKQLADAAAAVVAVAEAASQQQPRRSLDGSGLGEQLSGGMQPTALLGQGSLSASLPLGSTMLSAQVPAAGSAQASAGASAAGLPPLPPCGMQRAGSAPHQQGPGLSDALGDAAVSLADQMQAAAVLAAALAAGQQVPDAARRLASIGRSMSFDHILAELPRSESQVAIPPP